MFERDLRKYSQLAQLVIHEEDDPCTIPLQEEQRCNSIAEANDLMRLQDLLTRNEYEPIGIVRFGHTREGQVSVFFRLKDTDDNLASGERPSYPLEQLADDETP